MEIIFIKNVSTYKIYVTQFAWKNNNNFTR